MAKGLPKEVCKRCGHTWVRRVLKPKVCPSCQSAYWDTERTYSRSVKETQLVNTETPTSR